MTLITTAEQLAEAIVSDPERVAACLGRINRFGGQVANCTVLRHSLHVFERIDSDSDASDAARLWALLHDCHEILTGDVVRPYVTARLRMDQQAIDNAIARRLPVLDLIIDDGSHLYPDYTATADVLLGKLRPGGVYVIEDIQTQDSVDALRAAGWQIEDWRESTGRYDDVIAWRVRE